MTAQPASSAAAAPVLPDEVPGALSTTTRSAITYATAPGAGPLLLDLHLPPASATPHPVVVFVHGGGWLQGTRQAMGPRFADWSPSPFERVAASGIAVVSVDYRLSDVATWPAQLDDVVAALRWVRTHGAELGLDTDRIALWGESAGGHLAALVGLLGDDPVRGAGTVRAVVDWYGPSELLTLGKQLGPDAPNDANAPDSRESLLLGAAVQTVPDLARDASPVHHVTSSAPPFLLLHGSADRLVPAAQSEALARALLGSGASVLLELVDGADHLWLGPDECAAGDAFNRTVDFLHEHLM